MRKFAAFIRLSRLTFLIGGFAGFALGAAVAAYEGIALSLPLYLSGQLLVTAFHLMTHYSNDFFDRAADARAVRTPFSGGSGSLVDGSLPAWTGLGAAVVCAAVGLSVTGAFAMRGNTATAALGVAIAALAWSYSAPPMRLLGRGLGEFTTALVVGVLAPLTGYATFAGSVDVLAIASTIAPALAVSAMMIAVQWPDLDSDRASGKNNLLVRFGKAAMGRAASLCANVAVACAALVEILLLPKLAVAFAVLLALPAATFSLAIRDEARPGGEIAARGVALAFLTVFYGLLAYLSALP
jgi:1,4-dihydroxy-2-naphthoate octaprenyltransferase